MSSRQQRIKFYIKQQQYFNKLAMALKLIDKDMTMLDFKKANAQNSLKKLINDLEWVQENYEMVAKKQRETR